MDWSSIDIASIRSMFDSFGGLKTISEAVGIAKQLKELTGKNKDGHAADLASAEMRQLVVDLTNKMIDAREETATLRLRMLDILEELGRLQKFESNRDDYEIVETEPGNFAYRAVKPNKPEQAAIRYCVHCFEQSKRLVALQKTKIDWHRDTLKCGACGGEVFQANDNKMEVHVVRPSRWSSFDDGL